MSDVQNLGDIPDLSGITETEFIPFEDGWYQGIVNGKRTFTDKNGNYRLFETTDDLSKNGDSRNIRLQVGIKRATDNAELNLSYLVNYRPEDLTTEVVSKVASQYEKVKAGGEWGDLFRSFMTLTRLSKLQAVAGIRQFQRIVNGNGGLDLEPLYGKSAYFRIAPDERNPQYKQVVDVRVTEPKKHN